MGVPYDPRQPPPLPTAPRRGTVPGTAPPPTAQPGAPLPPDPAARERMLRQNAAFDAQLQINDAAAAQASGYQVGNRTYWHADANDPSKAAPLESTRERYINSQQNYSYGRDPLAADAAVNRARTMAGNYAIPLGGTARNAADLAGSLQGRAGPVTDFDLAMQARANQAGAYNALMGVGNAPVSSAAQAQLQLGTNQAMANQLALARSGRGAGESAAAMRQAQFANADIAQEAANQSAMLRANEEQAMRQRQIAAFGAAGELAGGIRGADAGQAQFLTDAELRSRQLNDAAGLGYTGLALQGYGQQADIGMGGEELANQVRMGQLQGSMGYEGNLTSQMLGARPSESGGGVPWGSLIGTGVGAVGGFFAGGVPGAVAGGGAGYQIGSQFDR